MKTTTLATQSTQAATPLADKTAIAFNGTIVNTGALYQLFDGVCAYVGLVSQDKKQFFPVHGIAHDFRFKAEDVITIDRDYEFWLDDNPFAAVCAEHEDRKSEHPESVSNSALWDEIVRNFAPQTVNEKAGVPA